MDGGDRQLVEFLEPEPEPVPEPPGAPLTRRRLAVPLACAGLLAALVVVTVDARHGPPAARPAATPSRGTGSLLAEIPQTTPLLRPIPALALLPTPRCPASGCSVLGWVADATLNAVRTAFPDARIVSQMSAFGPSDMGASDPLLAREVQARSGQSTLVIDVVQTGPADVAVVAASSVDVRVTGNAVRAEVRLPAYRIVVRARPAGRTVVPRIRRMLDDPGLMAVR